MTASGIYENPIIRKNQLRALRSLELGKLISFGNFARIANLCVGFHLGTLHIFFL